MAYGVALRRFAGPFRLTVISTDVFGDNCTAHASESLIVMLPLLPPSWFASLSVSNRSGKLFSMISFSLMVSVSACFLGWFRFQGCPGHLPSAYGIWHFANLLGLSSQGHLFAGSLSLQELNCRNPSRSLLYRFYV